MTRAVKISRAEHIAMARFARACEMLLLDLDAESVGRIADYVGEHGAGSDYDAVVDAVIVELLRLIVENHSGNEGRSVAFRGR